jgi:hypothetical protein
MAEKLNMGEVRCSGCKKIAKITDEYCPNCGAKIDPKGKLISFLVSSLVVVIGCFVGLPIYQNIIGVNLGILKPAAIFLGVIFSIAAVIAAAMLILNKVMRQKAFEEMGVKEK